MEFYNRRGRQLSLFVLCIALLGTWGCASRKFVISSYPEGAYIVGYGETTRENPLQESLVFLGKKDQVALIAMKRGYHPDTLTVTKESPLEVHFTLRAIEGIPPLIRRPVALSLENTNLLPLNVEIVLHKGIGAMDKYEVSGALSDQAWFELNQELLTDQSDSSIAVVSVPDTTGWKAVSAELEAYLQSLSPDLLAYYPEPPSVAFVLERYRELFQPVLEPLCQSDQEEYLVFGWCRSIKTTTGRIIGNMGLAVTSAAVSGYETAAYGYPVSYSDPSAFALDNSTLFMAYIIDPGSGEVLGTRQYVVAYDISDKERLQAMARSILLFPLAEKTPVP